MLRMSQNEKVHFIPVNAVITNFALGGMSASVEAWLDLLKLQKNYGMISNYQYKKELLKDKIYRLYKKCFKRFK